MAIWTAAGSSLPRASRFHVSSRSACTIIVFATATLPCARRRRASPDWGPSPSSDA